MTNLQNSPSIFYIATFTATCLVFDLFLMWAVCSMLKIEITVENAQLWMLFSIHMEITGFALRWRKYNGIDK